MVSAGIILRNGAISGSRGSTALDEKGLEKGKQSFPEEGARAWLWASLLRTNLLILTS